MNLPTKILDRKLHERWATPYVFRPRLSVIEAIVAAGFAFTRIVLGSLLFAFCGTGMWEVWARIHNPFWRIIVEVPLFAIFVVLFALLMYSISVLNRAVTRRG